MAPGGKRTAAADSAQRPDGTAFGAQDLRALAALGAIRTYRKHTIIASEGDESDDFHIVLSGRVKVFVSDEHGREIVVALHGPGEYFGPMVWDDRPRCASVITLEAARVAAVPRRRVTQFLEAHPRIALTILEKLMRHLCALTQKVKTLGLVNVYGRVARLLVELSTVEGGATVVERITHQDIANRVGASREMISKVLKELACQGYIRVDRRHITLLKRPPLGPCSNVIFSHRGREPHY